jgi:predicted dehydrogenase
MPSDDRITRRDFLKQSALGAAALGVGALAGPAPGSVLGANERLNVGVIGCGGQGTSLLGGLVERAKDPKRNLAVVGVCDVYEPRKERAKAISGAPVFHDYREMLAMDDLDAVVIATPDHWHATISIDAMLAGKDVYCEKPMSHTAAEGFEMVEAATSAGRIVQVGSQRTSSALCAKARELYSDGAIGEVSMVELCLGRNSPTGAWQYPPPPGLSPSNLDWEVWLGTAPKIPFNPERFARWRCWKEYGTGVAGDLMVHLISGMLYTLDWNEPPRSAQALGGIYRWRDGRNMPDLHTVLFDYGGVQVYVRLGLGTATPEVARFMGPKGILEATAETLTLSPQTGRDTYPSYYSQSFPRALREEYQARWHAENDPTPGMEPITGNTVYTGHDWDDTVPHLWAFFEAVRSREPVVQDAAFGNHAAIACHMANESYFRESPVQWDDGGRVIAS